MQKLRFQIFLILSLSLITSFFYSQINLVPNPSFESYTCCPNTSAQLNCTGNWFFSSGTTDYYNSCSPAGNMSVPWNIHGYQNAAEGNAYVGMITFQLNEPAPPFYREPVSTKLTQTLTLGQKYFVSFKSCLAIDNFESCCASNKLGALFSTIPFSNLNKPPINNFAHVYSNAIINDTINWTMIFGSFVADSNYTYITLGNFFSSSNTSYIDYKNNFPTTYASYYFTDDLKVSTDSSFVMNTNESAFDLLDGIQIFPNPSSEKLSCNINIASAIVQIFNSVGENVTIFLSIENNEIDLSRLDSGLYYLFIQNRLINKTKKIKIQKL